MMVLTPVGYTLIDTFGSCARKDHCSYTYVHGHERPHYQVPAIRQGYEFGWCLNTNEPTLIHWYQGRVDED